MGIQYKVFLFYIIFLIPFSLFGASKEDSIAAGPERPTSLSVRMESGYVFPTNDFVKNEKISHYSSLAIKYAFRSRGDRWEDIAYGMPYFGIGLYGATFYEKNLGTPISIFLFQGARITKILPKLSFHYEFNLGYSTNWKTYDRFNNPDNIAVGNTENIHVGGSIYLKFMLTRRWDANFGLGVTHFSNGAVRMPNKGLNLGTPFIELSYNFNVAKEGEINPEGMPAPPKAEKRIDHEVLLTVSSHVSRQMAYMNEKGIEEYINHKFRVFGVSYAPLFVSNYKYKWGPSVDLIYDESSGAIAWKEQNSEDLEYYERVKLGKLKNRFSLGLSLKGEIVMPHFSFFANAGYDVIHGDNYDNRLYQILGIKIDLNENIFGTFGIRATHFSKAQFIFWSGGYTFKGKQLKNKHILF